jgi:hypothetical protein
MPLPFPFLGPRGGVSGGATTQAMRVVPLGGKRCGGGFCAVRGDTGGRWVRNAAADARHTAAHTAAVGVQQLAAS